MDLVDLCAGWLADWLAGCSLAASPKWLKVCNCGQKRSPAALTDQSFPSNNTVRSPTDKQANAQAGRQAKKQPYKQTNTQTDRQTDRQTSKQTARQADRQTDRHTDRHTYRQTDR